MKCRYCGESFDTRWAILSHEWTKHESELRKYKPKVDITNQSKF